MSDRAATSKLPVGATVVQREPVTEKSVELAGQMARRGASKSLVRAIGGEEAVEKFFDGDQAAEETVAQP